jgi:hypothetical protein
MQTARVTAAPCQIAEPGRESAEGRPGRDTGIAQLRHRAPQPAHSAELPGPQGGGRGSAHVPAPEVPVLVLTVAVLVVFLALLTAADLFPALLGPDSTGLVGPLS